MVVRVPRRETCASGSLNATYEGFANPAAVKTPLCHPASKRSSRTRKWMSMSTDGVAYTFRAASAT